MSLQLKFNVCPINGCSQIRFTDNTGFYNPTNLGGWGAPNPDIINVNAATLTVTPPNSISYTINLYATTIFPSDMIGMAYDIPLSNIGSPTSIVDGQWIFVYSVTVSDGGEIPAYTTYTTTIYKYFYCNSECCVNEMLANLDLTCDCCKESDSYKTYELAWVQLESLKKAAACGDSTNFEAIKKIVDKLCKNNGCKTCK